MKIVLPAIINPPRIRKDRSISISFDTRELQADEMLTVLSLSQSEGWLAFQPNEYGIPELPQGRAEVDEKTPSERLKAVLYVWYKQRTEAGKYVGTFEAFKIEKYEQFIDIVKSKLV